MVPAVTEVAFALTQTKLPVKLALKADVDPSRLELFIVVPVISNQSSSVGVVANDPCIFKTAVVFNELPT